MSIVIRAAEDIDSPNMIQLAESVGVSTDGLHVKSDRGQFFLMEEANELIATAGMERLNEDGLLRTLIIDTKKCKMAYVVRFFDVLLAEAEKQEIQTLYMMTRSPALFSAFGFHQNARGDVPESLLQTEHYQKSAGDGVTLMHLTLGVNS